MKRSLFLCVFLIVSLIIPLYNPELKAQDSFLLEITKWDSYFRIPFIENTSSVSHRVYNLTDTIIEWEIILNRQPLITTFSFQFQSKDLVFYYQPPAYEDSGNWEFANETHAWNVSNNCGLHKPLNVVGSYAVYHSYLRGNEYTTGKIFHIYRPFLIDAENKTSWANLNITNNVFTVSANSSYLANAIYPVIIDPAFGKTDIGANSWWGADAIMGTNATCPESGTADSITWYNKYNSPGQKAQCILYFNTNRSWIATTQEKTVGAIGWKTHDFSAPKPSLVNMEYILCVWFETGTPEAAWDAGAVMAHHDTHPYNSAPDPLDSTTASREFSIFCNYTVAGGQTYTENPSIILNFTLSSTKTFYGTYPLMPSINLLLGLSSTVQHITALWSVNPSINLLLNIGVTTEAFKIWIQTHAINVLFALSSTVQEITAAFQVNPSINLIFSLAKTLEAFRLFRQKPSIALIFTLASYVPLSIVTVPVEVTTFGTVAFVIAIIALAIGVTALTQKKRD